MFFDKLKLQTKPFHDRLEHHKLNQILFQETTNFKDYQLFLDLQYCVWNSIEMQLKLYDEDLKKLDIKFNSRANDAKKELASFGVAPSTITFDTTTISNLPALLGALYLMEGSRHGGMVILKKIKEFAPQNHSFLFLEMNRELFQKRWQSLLGALLTFASKSQKDDDKLITTIGELYILIERFYDEYATINKL
ncbi:MAG: biliverdin-producing heme oxygenase [Arcobacteraceae bacterium]|jgi:heme oxygenase|nr:biliverdin-producing heme oxygenase [Arcobacteraceae bacterium]